MHISVIPSPLSRYQACPPSLKVSCVPLLCVCVYVCVKNTQHEIYSLCKFLNACYGLKIYCCYYYPAAKSCPAHGVPWTAAHQAFLSSSNSQFAQTHVHWVSNAIQPSHPQLSPSRLALNLSNIFSCSVHCLFTSLLVSLAVQKLLSLMSSFLIVLLFVVWTFDVISKTNHCPD